jgi:hypothetical protein
MEDSTEKNSGGDDPRRITDEKAKTYRPLKGHIP